MLKVLFKRVAIFLGVSLFVAACAIILLLQYLKSYHLVTSYCHQNEQYEISVKTISIQSGLNRLLRAHIEHIDITKKDGVCELAPASTSYQYLLWLLDWVEMSAAEMRTPYAHTQNNLGWAKRDLSQAEYRADFFVKKPLGQKFWESKIKASYQNGLLIAESKGDIVLDARFEDGQLAIRTFDIEQKGILRLQISNAKAQLSPQQLHNAQAKISVNILESEPIIFEALYDQSRFSLKNQGKIVAQGQIASNLIDAKGNFTFRDLDVSFLGLPYSFSQADWKKFSYNKKTGKADILFENIKMKGVVPITVASAQCEGDPSTGQGTCEIGKINGPEGMTFQGAKIVISGFSDILGTFQGSFTPSKLLPFKIPFLNIVNFDASFSQTPSHRSLVFNPKREENAVMHINKIEYYHDTVNSKNEWQIEAAVDEHKICCKTESDAAFCHLEQINQRHQGLELRPHLSTNSLSIKVPSELSSMTDIKELLFDFSDVSLWRVEAFNQEMKNLGQLKLSFDEGADYLSGIEAELWDMGFQGVATYHDRSLDVIGHNFNLDLVLDCSKAMNIKHYLSLLPSEPLALPLDKVSLDFQHFYAAGHDWGKMQITHSHKAGDQDQRWIIVHPLLRGQLSESHNNLEAVIYIDNLAGFAPLLPQLSAVGKGRFVINYHQSAQHPSKQKFFISGSDFYLKEGACQELQLLNVLSGYAFSTRQFQALLSDGWLIDKISVEGFLEDQMVSINQAFIKSGAASLEAKGQYSKKNDALAIDLFVHPKVSSALPSLGFLMGPVGAGLALVGVQLFGADNVDQWHEQKWQLCGSLHAPEVRAWQAEVIDLRASSDAGNGATNGANQAIYDRQINPDITI